MSMPAIRKALITGASAGLGEEYARQLAAAGCGLILVARRKERLDALAVELRERHAVTVDVIQADLMKDEDIARVEAVLAGTENIDLLVNNAGFGRGGAFHKNEIRPAAEMIQVHVLASVRLARAALGGMVSRGRGFIINVASLAAFQPFSGVMYGATKSFLVSFSRNLQFEVKRKGVRIQALCPGMTHTEFHAAMGEDVPSIPEFAWMSAPDVIRISLRALGRRKVIVVPGFLNKMVKVLMGCPLAVPVLETAVNLFIRKKDRDS
jgi:uncharacterized protein